MPLIKSGGILKINKSSLIEKDFTIIHNGKKIIRPMPYVVKYLRLNLKSYLILKLIFFAINVLFYLVAGGPTLRVLRMRGL